MCIEKFLRHARFRGHRKTSELQPDAMLAGSQGKPHSNPLIPTGGKINCGFFNMLFKNYRSHKVKQAAVGLHMY